MQCIATHCHTKRAFIEKHEHWVGCTKSHASFYFKYVFIRFQSLKIQDLKLSWLNCLEFLSFLNTEQYCTILQNQFFTPLSYDCSKGAQNLSKYIE